MNRMRLYKFRKLCGTDDVDASELRLRILDIVNNKRLYCEIWCEFPDEYEGSCISFAGSTPRSIKLLGKLKLGKEEKYFAKVANKKSRYLKKASCDRSRVCSLSLGPLSNEHMWKEYADDGAGVAIELAVRNGVSTIPLKKVKYAKRENLRGVRNVFEVLADSKGDIDHFSDNLLDYKLKKYAIENEVRLICTQSELQPPDFPGDANDKLALCEYKSEKLVAGENCYYNFSQVMDVVKVWCGNRISDDDFAFLISNIHDVQVVKYIPDERNE